MTESPRPGMPGVVEGLLGELRQLNDWIAEVRRDLRTSEERRIMLANALDSATAALEPALRDHYDHAIRGLLGDVGPPGTGRPVSDGRQEAVLQYLAEWQEQTITTTELRLMLERRRFASGRNFVSNLLKKFEKQGFVMRIGHGRYRVTRLHPQLFARRHGIDRRLRGLIRKGEEEEAARVRSL